MAPDLFPDPFKLLGKTSKKDRKRLALLTQARKQKETLPSKAIARELLALLSTEYGHMEAIQDCKSLAREWLVGNVNSIAIIDELLEHFAQQGLTTDQEIYRYLQDKT